MRGWEGLHGRPRPVPLAHSLKEHDHVSSRGRPSRPSPPSPTPLAPTDGDGLILRLMRMGDDSVHRPHALRFDPTSPGASTWKAPGLFLCGLQRCHCYHIHDITRTTTA